MVKQTARNIRNACSFLGLILAVVATSHCGPSRPVQEKNVGSTKGGETLYYLDLASPLSQTIDRASNAEDAKFIRVEVVEVTNPKQYALTFIVRYQPDNKTKIDLGTFSLFPANNPGNFLVATQGKVRQQGSIVLSMTTPDKVDPKDTVKVGVKKLTFVKQ